MYDNPPQIVQGHGSFAMSGSSFEPLASAEGAFYEIGCSSSPNVRKVRFELVCYTGQVCFDGIGLNVVGSPYDVERQGVLCRFDGEIVKENEVQIRIKSGSIVFPGGKINSFTQGERSLMEKPLK
jgi:hypothetical protein